MPSINPTLSGSTPIEAAGGKAGIQAAIRSAAARTQVDFDYLLGQARIESALDPSARAQTSSAAGLFQFTSQTWLETLHRHGERHGLGWAARGIASNGGQARIVDPALSGAIMRLRHDPQAASLMAGELAQDNGVFLQSAFGRPADHTELYLAHFLGADGARRFIAAHDADPGKSAADLFPQAAKANRGVFYAGGSARSLGEVRDLFAGKLERFAQSRPAGPSRPAGAAGAPLPPAGPSLSVNAPPPPAPRRPMSDILHQTFAIGQPAGRSQPAHVADAYARIARFGL